MSRNHEVWAVGGTELNVKAILGSPLKMALVILAAGALLAVVAIVLARSFYPQLSSFWREDAPLPRGPVVQNAPVDAPSVKPATAAIPPPAPEAEAPRELSWRGLEFRPYSGKSARLYGTKKLLAEAEQNLIDSVKELKDGSGLFPSASNRVSFIYRDFSDCDFRGPYRVTLNPGAGGGTPAATVEIPIEPQVLEWYPPRKLISSALVEAILSQEAPGYKSAPAWLRHGLALYFSGLGPLVEQRELLLMDSQPISKSVPLEESGDDSWVVGYWAVRALAGKKGPEGVKSVVDNLRFSGDLGKAFEAVGETRESVQVGYRSWVKGYLSEAGANRDAYLDMVGLLRREEDPAALKAVQIFLREHPVDLYAGDCRYYLGYSLYRLGRYDEAIRAFTDLLMNYPHSTTKQGKAHFFMGRCYHTLNYKPLAEEQYRLAAIDPSSHLLSRMAAGRLKEFD